ncbi:hypothetical protein [Dyella mobilis]|uniref:hypothetical protein n=1 Tax=Dyella mobilis TaxID=1849582 RepID=UPI00195A0491|nr:hypothetical protein [Dyella mobilis]
MNPNLDEVERDPAAGNIDFFRRIPKQQVASRVGATWAPNFYYRTSNVQLLMQAPIARLRAMLPWVRAPSPTDQGPSRYGNYEVACGRGRKNGICE